MRAIAVLLVLAFLAAGCIGAKKEDASPASVGGNETKAAAPGAKANASANMSDMPGMDMAKPVALTFKLSGIYPVNPAFDPAKAEVPAGALVAVTFQNTDLNPLGSHNWVLDKVPGAKTATIDQGKSATITFTAPAPGEYAYYCSIPGHRGAGMEGKLTVK